jgi:hypothetical protein
MSERQDTVYRILLDGRWVSTQPTREEAERCIDGWRREWDGEFEIQERRNKNARQTGDE